MPRGRYKRKRFLNRGVGEEEKEEGKRKGGRRESQHRDEGG